MPHWVMFNLLLRLSLNVGGDDVTEFLYVLLDRIWFPYKDVNLVRSYDWSVMEDLKARLCTLKEVRFDQVFTRILIYPQSDVTAINLYDFVVRRPGKNAEKYALRAYDEVILAPMVCLVDHLERAHFWLHNSSSVLL
jgi:actin-related protein 8